MAQDKLYRDKRIARQAPDNSIRGRINNVIIPGTTGGFYTIASGFMLITISAGMYLFGFIFNKPLPTQFDNVLLTSVGLLTVHAGRAILGERSTARIATESIQGIQSGQEISVNAQDGTVSAEISNTSQISDTSPYANPQSYSVSPGSVSITSEVRPPPPAMPEEISNRG